jgi:hypothetical protein
LHGIVETETYLASARGLMSEDERSAAVDLLAGSPEIGRLIVGTGGLLKVRVPLAGRGKRGGACVISSFLSERRPIDLMLAYARNEQDDLSPQQSATLQRLAAEIARGRP